MQLFTQSVVDAKAFAEVEIVSTVPGEAELNSAETPGTVVVTLTLSEPPPSSTLGV